MNKYYKGFTEPIKRYQKSEKYKSYRRKYEEKYRSNNRLMTRYRCWRATMIKKGAWTEEKELIYLAKRLL
jgi:hypothetical protein